MHRFIRTDHIDTIDPEVHSTWHNSIFITFDVDWAHDLVIQDTHDLCRRAGVKSTFFITHKSDYLESLRKDKNVSLGLHPNFLPLLNQHTNALSVEREIERLKLICPNAKACRSHGVVQGGSILKAMSNLGCTHDCNDMIPIEANIRLKPYKTVFDLVKTPFTWGDEHEWIFARETHFSSLIPKICHDQLFVVDFHPIHIFLNTESIERYEQTRALHQKPRELIKYRFEGYGTRNRFIELLELCKKP